jgi:hypothetical protein
MSNLRNLDVTTKIILIVLVIVLSFVVLFFISSEFLVEEPEFGGMMTDHMGNNNTDYTVAILLSLAVALIAGVLVTLWLKPSVQKESPATVQPTRIDELDIIKRALSDDEKQVLDEIRRAGEITQDSLRFRLEWSKAKLSRILTNLDKLNLIQRERFGKTYKVFLTQTDSDR